MLKSNCQTDQGCSLQEANTVQSTVNINATEDGMSDNSWGEGMEQNGY